MMTSLVAVPSVDDDLPPSSSPCGSCCFISSPIPRQQQVARKRPRRLPRATTTTTTSGDPTTYPTLLSLTPEGMTSGGPCFYHPTSPPPASSQQVSSSSFSAPTGAHWDSATMRHDHQQHQQLSLPLLPPLAPPCWQQMAVRESCHRIRRHVQHVIHQTPFLSTQETPAITAASTAPITSAAAKFCRHEIITGAVVGKGGFSIVSDVLAIQLDPRIDAQLTETEKELRRFVASQCIITDVNRVHRPRYVLKHLQEKLIKPPSQSRRVSTTSSSSVGPAQVASSSSSSSDSSSVGIPTDFAAAAIDLILEGEYLRRLQHPNVVQLVGMPHLRGAQAYHDEGRYDGFFLLLEKVDMTLEDAMQYERDNMTAMASAYPAVPYVVQDDDAAALHGVPQDRVLPRPSLDDKLAVSIQLAQALAYLHSHDIVFRDLKPQNVGLVAQADGSFRVVLLDFGLCRQLPVDSDNDNSKDPHQESRQEEQARHHHKSIRGVYHMSAVGTRRYLAVEVVNSSRYNELADVFSWSLVTWEYLTLTRPFPHYDVSQHALHVCQQGERPDTRGLSVEIQRLLQQCWTEDIQARLSMLEVVALLSAIVRSHYYDNAIMSDDDGMIDDQDEGTRDGAAAVGEDRDMVVSNRSLDPVPWGTAPIPIAAASFDDASSWDVLQPAHPVSPVSWHLLPAFDSVKVGPWEARKLNSSATTRSLSSDGSDEDEDMQYLMKAYDEAPYIPFRGGVMVNFDSSASASSCNSAGLSALSVSSNDHELSMSLVVDPRAVVATSRFDDDEDDLW